ncbi:AAA family ATPase [Deinococcus yavapaiensis]|uniref:Exonuclease SbcC n=1 Tax=Deinococcus yavapaiensis KR-236 TaxID=694435 RepID=A0A318SFX8_9DEIO|nr:SMC family ATPase [Deinococcus yavapaiensis]PYE52924.1 exonuclease SbcC [Deinococcus yavapaiensis KR-236]
MKPLKLTMQNFLSYQGHHEIDFDGLELFGIVGPTGGGKSALLDAMMYALYGCTPRVSRMGQGSLVFDSRDVTGMAVKLEFEVAGRRYAAARRYEKRRSGGATEARLEEWNGDRFVSLSENRTADTNKAIEKVVGLDFDSFTRAVVLPQGRFDELLKSPASKRRELLGFLVGLDHVGRMAEVAGKRKGRLDAEHRATLNVLDEEYAGVTSDAVQEWRRDAERAEDEAARLEGVRAQLAERQAVLSELANLHEERRKAAVDARSLEDARTSVEEGLARARRARSVASLLPLLELRDAADTRRASAASALAQRERELAAARAAVEEARGVREAAELALRDVPALEERWQALREAEAKLATLRRHGGTPSLSHARPRTWDEDALVAMKAQAAKLDALDAEAKLVATEERELAAFELRMKLRGENLAALEVNLSKVTALGKEIGAACEVAVAALEDARRRAGALSLRGHLHVGEPCPLCEQTVKVLPSSSASDVTALEVEAKRLTEERQSLREKFAETRARLTAEKDSLTRDRSDFERRREDVAKRRGTVEAARTILDANAKDEVTRLLAGLAAQLRDLGEDPSRGAHAVKADIEGRRNRMEKARGDEARAAAKLASATTAHENAERDAAEREEERARTSAAVESALSSLGFSEAEARRAALPEVQVRRLEDEHRVWQGRRERVEGALAELDEKLAGRTFDPQEYEQVKAAARSTEAALVAARKEVGAASQRARDGEVKLARKAEFERKAKALSLELDTWAELATALRANEFPQFLLAEIEEELLERAGTLLSQLTDGRYELRLESGEYSVQDAWNGGEIRSVRTLSGGETFLASLSLAVALSDYLAGNAILGALFLDEGFGTLDPQVLDAVANIIEQQQTGGRVVGIITHVESLSERLPARILVSKSVTGSRAMRLDAALA